jgi:hypothetical protein
MDPPQTPFSCRRNTHKAHEKKELTSMQSKRMRRRRRSSRVIVTSVHIRRAMLLLLLLLLLSDGRHQPPPDNMLMLDRRRCARGRRIVVAPCRAGAYMAGSSGGTPAVHAFDVVALFLCGDGSSSYTGGRLGWCDWGSGVVVVG